MIENRLRLFAALLAGALTFALTAPSFAETARRTSDSAKEQSSEANRLPADVTTDQTVELPGRTLRFKAIAGSIPINNTEGKLQAEIAYIAYVRPDGDAATRPVTFAFNGGPGASSAYLHLGAMGPWRLPLDGITPSSTPTVVPNPETWLDFTDLVFVDPVGTGYSRFINTSDEVRKQFWSVDGDIDVLATFMRKWIEKNGRQASKKFIAGESYGGIRAPRLASKLNEQGVGSQRACAGVGTARSRLARQTPLPARLGRAAAVDGSGGPRREISLRPRGTPRGRALRGRRVSAGPAARRARQRSRRTHHGARRAVDGA